LAWVRVTEFTSRILEVLENLLIGPHVAEDADRSNDIAVCVAQCRRVKCRRNDLAGSAPWVEWDVSAHAVLDHLPERGNELARLVSAEKSGHGLLDDLVLSEAKD
jgi:hypothetical protein